MLLKAALIKFALIKFASNLHFAIMQTTVPTIEDVLRRNPARRSAIKMLHDCGEDRRSAAQVAAGLTKAWCTKNYVSAFSPTFEDYQTTYRETCEKRE